MKLSQKWITSALVVGCLAAPVSMSAQLHPSFGLDAGFDTRGSNFYGAGMYMGIPTHSAWSPYIDIYSYYLNYPAGATRGSARAFAPGGGLQYAAGRSSVNFGAGYAFVNSSGPRASNNVERGSESGATASFGAHTQGMGERPYKAEFLSNFNFGSDFLWTRARASVPVGYSVAHPARLGFEAGAQGANHNGSSSHSYSFGPTFEYKISPALGFTVAAGPKFYSSGGTGAYLGVALSISP